jgi:hypothetical protein
VILAGLPTPALSLELFRVQQELGLIFRGFESQGILTEGYDAFVGDGFQALERIRGCARRNLSTFRDSLL